MAQKDVRRAFAFAADGYVDTGFDLNRVDGRSHSTTLRFMLQYPNSYYNDFVGEAGNGGYVLAKLASRSDGSDLPGLTVNIGNVRLDYEVIGGLVGRRWYSLALTVDADRRVRLYLDGLQLVASSAPNGDTLTTSGWATGRLILGRRSGVDLVEQFYGLLDDIAVWDHPLSAEEIAQLVVGPGLRDSDSGLLAGWTGDDLPASKANMPFTVTGSASLVANTGTDQDASLLPATVQSSRWFLPLDGDWFVAQGADSPPSNSHRGYAAFAIDLAKPNATYTGPDPNTAGGEPVYAVADGHVVFLRDSSPEDQPSQQVPSCVPCRDGNRNPIPGSCDYEPNEVLIQHTIDEYSSYLHLQPGSIPAPIKQRFADGTPVRAGEQIGTVGRSGTGGYHLHFACLRTPALPDGKPGLNPGQDIPITPCGYVRAVIPYAKILTRPFVLTGYQVRQADGTYRFLEVGVPEAGMIIRDGAGALRSATGKLLWLRVNELGTGFGPSFDFLDVESEFALDTAPELTIGLQLRRDTWLRAHRAMLDILRSAFRQDRVVAVDYEQAGLRSGLAVRVTSFM